MSTDVEFLAAQNDQLRAEISRLTAELADEKAVNEHQRSELQDRVKKQRAAEAELATWKDAALTAAAGIIERDSELEEARKGADHRLAALKEISAMYANTWDRIDGALIMMGDGVDRFEEAHANVLNCINAAAMTKEKS